MDVLTNLDVTLMDNRKKGDVLILKKGFLSLFRLKKRLKILNSTEITSVSDIFNVSFTKNYFLYRFLNLAYCLFKSRQ